MNNDSIASMGLGNIFNIHPQVNKKKENGQTKVLCQLNDFKQESFHEK
jgi:hypothetical protein